MDRHQPAGRRDGAQAGHARHEAGKPASVLAAEQRTAALAAPARYRRICLVEPDAPLSAARIPADAPPRRLSAQRCGDHPCHAVAGGGKKCRPRPSRLPGAIGDGYSLVEHRLLSRGPVAGPRLRSAQPGGARHLLARSGLAGSLRGRSGTATPRTRAPSRRRSGREALPGPS